MSLHNSTDLKENQDWTFLKLVESGTKTSFCSYDQANKSARGMPCHQEPMKDVISCDKVRGAANELRSGHFRMGKPTCIRYDTLNHIGV